MFITNENQLKSMTIKELLEDILINNFYEKKNQ